MRKLALAFLTTGFLLAGCTPLDPAAIADLIKKACAIVVPIVDVAKIIDADKAAVPDAIVNIVCSAYKSSVTTPSASAADAGPRTIVVHVNGKDIQVHVTPAK